MTNLPSGWTQRTLGEVVDILDSKRIPVNRSERAKRPGQVPYYGATGQVGTIDRALFNEELVLLGEDGVPFLDAAKPKAYLVNGPSWVNNHAHVLRAVETITSNRFLCHFLNTFDYTKHVNGTTRLKLTQAAMRSIPVPVPPLAEQRRIVDAIEEHFACIDAAEAALHRCLHNADALLRATLNAAAKGDITFDWREQNPTIQSADDVIRDLGGEPVSFPGPLPSTWTYSVFKPLLSVNRPGMKTGPFGSMLKKHEHQSIGVPVIGIENVEPMAFRPGSRVHITPRKAAELSGYDVQPNDVLISRSGTVGEVCVAPPDVGEARFSSNLMRVVLRPEGILPDYFALLLNGSRIVLRQISDMCKGTTRDFINQRILSQLVLPLPPLAEQREILDRVFAMMSIIDVLRHQIDRACHRSQTQRRSILAAAFSGTLVSQDARDEPAAILLQRIAAEDSSTPRLPYTRKTGPQSRSMERI